jgi:hypothetical protein
VGVNRWGSGGVHRAYQPSGPWIDSNGNPAKSPYADSASDSVATKEKKADAVTGNPDPNNYQLVQAEEKNGFLVVKIRYPDCTNYEGNKILVFKDVTLIQLVNQKLIDPHFFQNNKKYTSPIARFVPTDEGWEMALALIEVLSKRKK